MSQTKSSFPKLRPQRPLHILSGNTPQNSHFQPKDSNSQTPHLCSQQSFDLISYFPKTTIARPKIHVTNLSTNILNNDYDIKSLQQSPKSFKLLKSNKQRHTKSTAKLPKHDPEYGSIFIEDSANSLFSAKSPFLDGKVFLQEYDKFDKVSPTHTRGGSLGLFPGTMKSNISLAGSPTSIRIERLERMEEGIKIRRPKAKPSSDQQKIAARAALKYFSSIQDLNPAKKQQLSPLRTKNSLNTHEISRMLKGRINMLVKSQKQGILSPADQPNIRIYSRMIAERRGVYGE